MHLTKLRPPSSLRRWTESYRDHLWDPVILQEKQASSEKRIESKLCLLGRDAVLAQRNTLIFGYLKDLSYGNLTNLKRKPLQELLNDHMVRKRLWEPTDEIIARPTKRRSRRYSISASLIRRQAKKRKRSSVNLSVDKTVVNTVCIAAPKKKKQKKNRDSARGMLSNIDPTFRQAMRNQYELEICDITGDTSNLFRAISHQLYGDESLHGLIRNRCCRYLEINKERFQTVIDEDENHVGFTQYLERMRSLKIRGGKLEIVAISELYRRRVEVYSGQVIPDITVSDVVKYDEDHRPIRLMLRDGKRYYSVITKDHSKNVFVCNAGVFEDAALFENGMIIELGFHIYRVPMDGNCLFTTVGHQIYGDISLHGLIREKCCDYMEFFSNRFFKYIDQDRYVDFADYLDEMRTLGEWGGNLEITALSELYQRRVEIYDQQTTPRLSFSESVNYNNDHPPIRMTYKYGVHYDSVVAENHGNTVSDIDIAGNFEDAVILSLAH